MSLPSRVIVSAALIALGVMLGVWLSRPPVTAAAPAPMNSIPIKTPAEVAPESTLAPLPLAAAVPASVEGQVEAEIAAAKPSAKSAEPTPEPHPICQPRRRGLFRRR